MTPPAYRSGISVRQQPRDPFVRAVPMVRIRFPPAENLQTFGPSRVAAIECPTHGSVTSLHGEWRDADDRRVSTQHQYVCEERDGPAPEPDLTQDEAVPACGDGGERNNRSLRRKRLPGGPQEPTTLAIDRNGARAPMRTVSVKGYEMRASGRMSCSLRFQDPRLQAGSISPTRNAWRESVRPNSLRP